MEQAPNVPTRGADGDGGATERGERPGIERFHDAARGGAILLDEATCLRRRAARLDLDKQRDVAEIAEHFLERGDA